MTLLDSTRKFIEKERLFSVSDSVLIGVSGGKDSMCLLHVLQKSGYRITVAHVNYQLRGSASEKDAEFVKNYCSEHQIDCHIHTVSKQEALSLKANNLQEAAREIRYLFFQKLKAERGYNKIAIAHHINDVAETFLLNALRGSGSDGLRSIQAKSGDVVRPFLFCTQEDISNYGISNKVPYRNDESNEDSKYARNFVRNKILPILESRWPLTAKKIGRSALLLSDENKLSHHLINQEKTKWVKTKNGKTEIGPIPSLILLPGHKTLVWHLLRDFGITHSDIDDILESHEHTGKNFSTRSHSIIIDRGFLKIENAIGTTPIVQLIEEIGITKTDLGVLKIEAYDSEQKQDQLIEIVDRDKVQFPLTLRRWQYGDKWKPLGMKGRSKKISDYLIDRKVDRLSKEKILVLLDAQGNIIWLVGHRVSDLIKTTDNTASRLRFIWGPKLK